MITSGKAWSFFPRYRTPLQVPVNTSFLLFGVLFCFFFPSEESLLSWQNHLICDFKIVIREDWIYEMSKGFEGKEKHRWWKRKIIYLQSLNREQSLNKEQIEKKKKTRYRARKSALCLVVNCYQPLLSKKIKDVLICRNKCMCYVGL